MLAPALANLVVIASLLLLGGILFGKAVGSSAGIWLAFSSAAITFGVTVLRYTVAVGDSQYAVLTSDTFRYLTYGRRQWLDDTPLVDSLLSGDGTSGTIGLSQVGFALLGDHQFAVFLSGSLLGLLGCWLAVLGLWTVRPDMPTFYAYLIILFPSVLYWSSSFGKEAFSILSFGLAIYGLAHLWVTPQYRSRISSVVLVAFGVVIAFIVRPDFGLLLTAAACVALCLVATTPKPHLRRAGAAALVLGVPLLLVAARPAELGDTVLPFMNDLTSRHERTSLGNSQIGASRPEGLLGLVTGLPAAVFRPFPWENGIGGLGSSLDTPLILYAGIRLLRQRRYAAVFDTASMRLAIFAGVIVLVLFLPLAGYGNLGLLARMRSLAVLPLLMVFALLHARHEASVGLTGSRTTVRVHAERRKQAPPSGRAPQHARGAFRVHAAPDTSLRGPEPGSASRPSAQGLPVLDSGPA